jgi:NADPH2:quinone reductase
MIAIQFYEYGPYDNLQLVRLPEPALTDDKLLVKITFVAINASDNRVRLGELPQAKKPPMVLGNEAAGVVVIGNEDFPEGSRVIVSCFTPEGQIRGIFTDGTWQEYMALSPLELICIPDGVSDEEAAAFPVGFFSAQACLNRSDFAPGKSVLSLAGGGTVGNAVAQLAKAHGSRMIITTASSSTKAKALEEFGFSHVINLENESVDEGVMRLTGGKGVDIAIDCVGGALTGKAIRALATNGTIVSIGYVAGKEVCTDITEFIGKSLQLRGQSLSGWFDYGQQTLVWNQILKFLASGKICPRVARIFPVSKAAEAQRYQIEERPFGKVLMRF